MEGSENPLGNCPQEKLCEKATFLLYCQFLQIKLPFLRVCASISRVGREIEREVETLVEFWVGSVSLLCC